MSNKELNPESQPTRLFLEQGPCEAYNAQLVKSGFKSAIKFTVSSPLSS